MYAAFVFNSLTLDTFRWYFIQEEVNFQSDLPLEFKRQDDRLKMTFSTDYLYFSLKYQMESFKAC